MSGMMLHGLGDCTPELNCGCMAKSPRDVLRERITRALWDNRYPGYLREGALWNLYLTDADAVVAALGLVEKSRVRLGCADGTAAIVNGAYVSGVFGGCPEFQMTGTCPHCVAGRHWETPWERIEEDA